MTFSVEHEWENGAGVSDPALAATWARVSIRVGQALVRVYDVKDVRTGFYGSLLPLAEWIVDSWPRLIHERMLPTQDPTLRRWRGFHSFQAARDGGAMPDLRLRRIDSKWTTIELVPDAQPLPGVSVRFLDSIRERVPVSEVCDALGVIVKACCTRLQDVDPERASALHEAWQRNGTRFADYAARLEPDDEALSEQQTSLIAALESAPECDLIVQIAEALPRQRPLDQRLAVARRIASELKPSEASKTWQELKGLASRAFERPWLTGWAAASALRDALGLKRHHVFAGQLRKFCADRCGWPMDQQVHVVQPNEDLKTVHFDTVHARCATRLPLVVTTQKSAQAQQFRVARSLYYSLVAGREVERLEAITDAHHAPLFSEASAFAAELLAPSTHLRKNMPSDGIWDEESVDEIARSLAVSPVVVRHQIKNQGIGELEDAYD